MIDIHSHILPGVDDGAKTEDDSIAIAKGALDEGIHTIVATPHHMNGSYENEKQSIIASASILQNLFRNKEIPLTVLPGQEIRLFGEIVHELQDGSALSLNETKYVMVEFPSTSVPRYAEQVFFDMQVAGYLPVIVHPERNSKFLEKPQLLYNLVQKGALGQLTAGSITGKFGKSIQKFSHQLIKNNLVHFIASDVHNTTSRKFFIREAMQTIMEDYGNELYYVMMENSQLAVNNQTIHKIPPEPIRQKRFFGIF